GQPLARHGAACCGKGAKRPPLHGLAFVPLAAPASPFERHRHSGTLVYCPHMSKQKEHGISARNREFIHYDQVEKRQDYQLAEAAAKEEFDEDFKIKTCDLGRFLRGDSKDQQRFAGELGEALEEIGFAILEGD